MQIRGFVFGACLLLIAGEAFAAPKTMRLDYYHSGNDKQELFSVDRVVIEPLEWPGHPDKAIDRTNLASTSSRSGTPSGRVLYSRGFASVYGEWETTDEARKMNRTFHESVRFPAPDGPVKVVIRKRDAQNEFQDAWTAEVDPKTCSSTRSSPPAPGAVIEIRRTARRRQSGRVAARRRLHRGRTGQVRARRATDGGHPVCHLAFQGTAARLQRVGARAGGGRVRASRVPRPGFIVPRQWGRLTTRSAPSATC